MSLKKKIISFAKSNGADLVGIADVGIYADYLEEARARLRETGADGKDFMLAKGAKT